MKSFKGPDKGQIESSDINPKDTLTPMNSSSIHLYNILERVTDPLIALDSNWNYTFVSERSAEFLNRDRAYLIGKNMWTEFPEYEGTPFCDAVHKAMKQQVYVKYEQHFEMPDKWMEFRLFPSSSGLTILFVDVTIQRMALEKLSQRELELKALVENSPDIVARINQDFRYLYINSSIYKILGVKPVDIIGRRNEELGMKTEMVKFWETQYQKVFDEKKELEVDYEYNIEGRAVILNSRFIPEFDMCGIVKSLLIISRDITQEKDIVRQLNISEKALNESKERIAQTEEFSLVMLTHVALDGTWLKVPQSLCDLVGYTEEELLNGKFEHITHPDDIEPDLSLCRKLIKGEMKSFDLEKRYITKDGRIVWIDINCSIVADEKGKPVHFITYIRDITERKRLDVALEDSEKRFRILFEKSPFAICISRKGIILFMNSSFLELVAYDQESELIGKHITDLIAPVERDYVLGRISARDGGEEVPSSYELMGIRKDGHIFPVKTEISYIDLPDGQATLSYVKDITESKKAELALKQSELALKEINHDLNTFIYKSSHDLKGPLASIMGLTNVAKNEVNDATLKHYLELISQSTLKLDNTLMNLLKMIHIRENSLEKTDINFKKLIEEILASLAHMPDYNNIEFILNIRETDFKTDINTLNSVLQNLIDNCIKYQQKYTSAPYVKINVSPFQDGVKIEVEDNGVGIRQDLQDKVFNMFVRGNQNSKGSGLGLYITKTAVEKLKGTIELISESNKGVKFIIYLPSLT